MLETILLRQKAIVGSNHRDTLITLWYAVTACLRDGGSPGLIAIISELRDSPKGHLQNGDEITQLFALDTMSGLGRILIRERQFESALQLFRDTVAICKATFATDHEWVTPQSMADLAKAYDLTKHYSEAEALAKEWLSHCRAKSPTNSLESVDALQWLGLSLLRQNKFEEAVVFLRECDAIPPAGNLFQDWNRAWVKSLLGGALLGQGKLAESEPSLLAGYDGMTKPRKKKGETDWHYGESYLGDTLTRLVQLYTAWDKPEKAAEWQKKLDEFDKAAAEKKKQ